MQKKYKINLEGIDFKDELDLGIFVTKFAAKLKDLDISSNGNAGSLEKKLAFISVTEDEIEVINQALEDGQFDALNENLKDKKFEAV